MISIIGAGPSGNYLAYLLAKEGKKVCVYEKDAKVGEPVQCTGILTQEVNKIIKIPKEIIINKIKYAKVITPNKKSLIFKLKKEDLIIDRLKFDQHLAKIAKKAGAKYFFNHVFISNKNKVLKFKSKNKEIKKQTNVLVGADGPISKVAKNIPHKRNFVFGHQVIAKGKFKQDTVLFYLGFGDFAWIVPESKTKARIGLISKSNTKRLFDNFLKDKNIKIEKYQAGPIPIYNKRLKPKKSFIYLLGDAATQVKPTTYGGIVQGLMAAKNLSLDILKNKNYLKLNKKLNKDLKYGSKIRKILNLFSKEDFNELINLLNKKQTKEIIESISRDKPSKILFKVIFSQPKLLKYLPKLFKR